MSSNRLAVVDISSAEEESIRRKRLKEKAQKNRAAARALEKPQEFTENKKSHEESKITIHIQPLSQFAEQHKYLTLDNPQSAVLACERSANYFNSSATARGSAFESLVESLTPASASVDTSNPGGLISDTARRCREAHKKACEANPAESMIFHTLLHRCFLPMYHPRSMDDSMTLSGSAKSSEDYDKAVSSKLESELKRRMVELPHFSSEYEQSQLKEAGEWEHQDLGKKMKFPACANGAKCICQQVSFPMGTDEYRSRLLRAGIPEDKIPPFKQGFTMMGFFYEDQFQAFLKDGSVPSPANPCICCVRDSLIELSCYLKSIQAMDEKDSSSDEHQRSAPELEFKTSCLGLFRNSIESPGGYFKCYMGGTSATGTMDNRPIISPILALNRESLSLRRDAEGRRWLDQSKLVWRPSDVPTPGIAENVKLF